VCYAAATLILLLPALWNGYALLQYDTGGYLARWYEGYLVPSRSTVFGLYLHFGESWHFWPELIAQSAITVWIVALTLRLYGLGRRPWLVLGVVAILSALTTLPWLSSVLLTDIFVVPSVLALHFLLFRANDISRLEQGGLLLLIAFAGATHSATLAMLLGLVILAALLRIVLRSLVSVRGLAQGAAAVVLGALMLLTANFALSGKVAWTPGGYGIAFGRMLQDGIVARYLKDHCPDPALRLCPYRKELPKTADEFLWSYGIFNDLGRFDGMAKEMRTIVLGSLAEYPFAQIETAAVATAKQLVLVATGAGVHNQIWHTYGIFERYIPGEVAAMHAARQQLGLLHFSEINKLHVPVALLSMVGMLALLLRFRTSLADDLALLAFTATAAILANAFLCGALSGPHDRYGARIVWIAPLILIVALLRKVYAARFHHGTVTATP
jgi:hypothetical protein